MARILGAVWLNRKMMIGNMAFNRPRPFKYDRRLFGFLYFQSHFCREELIMLPLLLR